ncbi:hypothetical protein [Streptomyces sp. Tu 2975]|uniref:hypothetical protein n=1 Tax=Streptomyces sp. Tu 2975 TaxID=2676871 RepID=UPI001FC92B7C|nr:hypothetical protein [Streptomyces sp. Tu 2975]
MPARPSGPHRSPGPPSRRRPDAPPSGPVPSAAPTPSRRDHPAGSASPAGDVVRWGAFSCLLVPVVLVVYGTSVGGAAAAALGLAAVTAACRVLLRHSERTAARCRAAADARPAGGRHSGTVPGARRGARHGSRGAPGG